MRIRTILSAWLVSILAVLSAPVFAEDRISAELKTSWDIDLSSMLGTQVFQLKIYPAARGVKRRCSLEVFAPIDMVELPTGGILSPIKLIYDAGEPLSKPSGFFLLFNALESEIPNFVAFGEDVENVDVKISLDSSTLADGTGDVRVSGQVRGKKGGIARPNDPVLGNFDLEISGPFRIWFKDSAEADLSELEEVTICPHIGIS